MKQHFNDGWFFTEEYTDILPFYTVQQAQTLIPVRIPHTVKELPFNYCDETAYQMVSGYLHPLFAPEQWQGKVVLLTFGAAAHQATVYCNGKEVINHHCGYTAFTANLSDYLNYDEDNMIAVRLDSRENLDHPPLWSCHRLSDLRWPVPGYYPGGQGAQLYPQCFHSRHR